MKNSPILLKIHNALIRFVVGRRPVIMNVELSPRELDLLSGGSGAIVETRRGLFCNVLFLHSKTHMVAIANRGKK